MTAQAAQLPATTKSRTPTLAPQLPANLLALVMSSDQPVVGPKAAAQLRAFAAEQEPELATRDQVDVMIGKLAIATAQPKITEAEANERLELYWLALNEIPVCDLRVAFTDLVKTATFLPTPAEVRAAAMRPGAKRRFAKSRARHLAWKHEQEWTPPVELMEPEEVQALLASPRLAQAGEQ